MRLPPRTLALALALLPTTAHAAEPMRVACLGIGGGEGFTPQSLVTLEELLLTALDESGRFKAIGKADVATLLDLERRRQVAGCNEEASCLAEIVGALGMKYALAADAGTLGELKVIILKLLDTSTGEVLARAKRKVDDGDLDAAITDVVRELRIKVDARGASEKSATTESTKIGAEPSAPALVTPWIEPEPTSDSEGFVRRLARKARAIRARGDLRDSDATYILVLSEYKKRGFTPNDGAAANAAAEAAFILTHDRLQAFAALSLAPKGTGDVLQKDLAKQLKRLVDARIALREQYESVIAFGSPPWTIAARTKIASVDERFAAKVLSAPCPVDPKSEFADEACTEFRIQLEQLTGPIDERAFDGYGTALKEARAAAITNEWVELAQRRFCSRRKADPLCAPPPKAP